MKKAKGRKIIFKLILFFMVTSIIIAIFRMWPETKADETIPKTITIQFSYGEKQNAFDVKSYTLNTNEITGYVTLPESFESTVIMNESSYFEKVDNETYYFEEDDYSYTFTGWKISNTDNIIPSETVFQPGNHIFVEELLNYDNNNDGIIELEALWGKVIYAQNQYSTMYYTDYWILDLETTKTYEPTGSWNYKEQEDGTIILNDGKDIENPICSLDYAYYLIYQMDYNNSFENAKSHNAYDYVVMLTGDLDYVKSNSSGQSQKNFFKAYDIYNGTYDSSKHYVFGEYTAQQGSWGYVYYYNSTGTLNTSTNDSNARAYSPSVTFKSCLNDGVTYNLYLNGYGYFDNTFSSIRIDNVSYVKSPDTKRPKKSTPVSTASETAFLGRKGCFIEFTSRTKTDKYTFRPNAVQTVVVTGGSFSGWQTSYSSGHNGSSFNYDIAWYMGDKATVSGDITLGTTSSYESNTSVVNQNITFTMTGGSARNIYGASSGIKSSSIGKRTINIIGDKGSSVTTNPKVTNIYGAGKEGIFTGNAYVNILGVTNITNVYGGGYAFTATTYGNTDVKIINSSILGDVYGGGLNGNVEKDSSENGGNVNLYIDNSKVAGNIFGSGMGGTQTLTTSVSIVATQSSTDWQNILYLPTSDKFNNIKNPKNGDYATDWSWDKPATGFPYMQGETDYICTAIYKQLSWTDNNKDSLTFQRYYVYSYLSIATVENDVNITIDQSEIGTKGDSTKGNVYGGGSLAVVGGDTYVTVKGNSKIYGSIYGGGDGETKPEEVLVYYPASEDGYTPPNYTVTKDSSGNVTKVSCKTESTSYKKFKYENNFKWSNEAYLLEQNGIDIENNLLYSPNVDKIGIVNGDTNVVIENSEIAGNVFAGGNAASVLGNTNIKITNSTMEDVYGGGYSGNVEASTQITVNSGNMNNLFGGGNLGVVGGNTTVTIGSSSNPNINISQLLYGGGRGKDEDGDGDASDFTTVSGTATVTIEGINTYVENYGSKILGKVEKEVNVTFKNYWTGNATNKYKTMNGIDRANNVYFENSYVLLTNKDENGDLVGIQSIENLHIPEGSGLKISASGEISGNFEGGGELYLDSEVCLTIQKDVTGSTTLVLNPLMYTENYIIKGGIDNPYLIVYGDIPEGSIQIEPTEATALTSGDSRYIILYQKNEEYAKYFINEDVSIDYNIVETIILKDGKNFEGNVSEWQTSNINIMQNEIITANFKLNYEYKYNSDLGEKYKNIERSIIIKSGEDNIQIPKNTKITMIVNEYGNFKYYKYLTTDNIESVKLSEFTKMENNNENYVEINDITEKAQGDSLTLIYNYNEEYRLILDFSDCENYLEAGKTYNVLLNLTDSSEVIQELNFASTNTINIYNKRNYAYTTEIERNSYPQNGNVKLTGNLNIDEIEDITVISNEIGKNISVKLLLKDENSNIVNIPKGTIFRIDGTEYEVSKSSVSHKLLELTRESISKNILLELDMSKVILEEQKLPVGVYKLETQIYLSQDDILQQKICENLQEFKIIEASGYGIDAVFTSTEENKDKIQLFNLNSAKILQISVDEGNLEGVNIKMRLQKRTAAFNYTDITNTITDNEISNENLNQTNNITVKLDDKLQSGMYRIAIDLYDIYGNKYVEKVVNFIVGGE